MTLRKALFIDRDGTIIRDTGYPHDPAIVELVPGATANLLEYQTRGHLLIIVSNQSGIGRGLITDAQYRAVHARTIDLLAAAGVEITGSYFCPHAPETNCFCRKPRPGMLLLAACDHRLDLRACTVMGDKPSDVEAGRAVGCQSILVRHTS